MWFTLGKLALKTGAEIYKNKKRAKLLESEAEAKTHGESCKWRSTITKSYP